MINEFNDKLNRDPMRCKFKIAFEKNTPSSKDTHLDEIMSYNDILDYVERENNNENGNYWRFRKIKRRVMNWNLKTRIVTLAALLTHMLKTLQQLKSPLSLMERHA